MARPDFSLKSKFPLHYLAKVGDHQGLECYLEANPISSVHKIIGFDFSGKTVLHHAAAGVHSDNCNKCVEIILNYLNELDGDRQGAFKSSAARRHTVRVQRHVVKSDDRQETINFINIKDTAQDTALHLAARNENAKMVTTLLLHSADIMAVNKDGTQALTLIYANTPSAVTEILNRSVCYDYGIDAGTAFTKTERQYCLDFTPVIGGTSQRDDKTYAPMGGQQRQGEASFLNSVNEHEVSVRKEILTHPLVRLFVDRKFQKLFWIMWTSILIKLLWISLYIWHTIDVYYQCCEGALDSFTDKFSPPQRLYCSQYPFENIPPSLPIATTTTPFASSTPTDSTSPPTSDLPISTSTTITTIHKNGTWMPGDAQLAKAAVMDCATNGFNLFVSIPLCLFTIYVIGTILFKALALRRTYLKIQNGFMWVFTVFVLITLFPIGTIFKLQFQIAAFAVVNASFVILEIINKHIYWGIYMRVLIKVLKRFLAILPLFLFLILAFSVSLRMLFPTVNPALKDFRNAIMEVFSVIANGKVEWTEGNQYKEGVDGQFPFSGFVMFVVFYVFLVLLLFRILIGFVVADTKKIQEQEELNEISQDLKSIYLLEVVTSSKPYLFLSQLRFLRFLKTFHERFRLFADADKELWLGESDIPKSLRKPLRGLASKNPAKYKNESLLKINNFNTDDSGLDSPVDGDGIKFVNNGKRALILHSTTSFHKQS